MCPQYAMPVSSSSLIDEQIQYLEDFLTELEPDTSPTPAPIEPESQRITDLRQAKSYIDKAITLLKPHFSSSGIG